MRKTQKAAAVKRISPLRLLAREDKWYLGGGNRLLWAPPFPVWLEYPGFWDGAQYYNLDLSPVFTWTLLEEDGTEITLRQHRRTWDPAKLTSEFRDRSAKGPGLRVTERKCLLPGDVLASNIRIENLSRTRRTLHLVAWTIQEHAPAERRSWISDAAYRSGAISFAKHVRSESRPEFSHRCALGMSAKVSSHAIQLSEGTAVQPHWRFTPFVAKFRYGSLPNRTQLTGVTDAGLVYMAIHAAIDIAPHGSRDESIFFAAAPSRAEASTRLRQAKAQGDPVCVSESSWNDFFSSVPSFTSSDEFFTRYYWYRWYGLRLLTSNGGEGNYAHPSVSEGIGYFRAPISYSAVCHVLENRWMHDPALARGSLRTFVANQREDGAYRGYIDPDYYRRDALGEPFYHANWGKAVLALHAHHPDAAFLASVYPSLCAYARYFDRERDAESSGLYDIDNHYETGQEYMHRYLAVDENADRDNWGEVFRLKGVDASVYIYELKRALASVAELLGEAEAAEWSRGAERTKAAVLAAMWDPEAEMFFDVDPRTGKRTGVKAATCFYPYMTGIVDARHTAGLRSHLLNAKEFWTPRPVPSSSLDDPYFSSEAEWKGKRMNCPWNGRVWPMTNSHIAEALAETARRTGDAGLRREAGEFIVKFVRMLFQGGDASLPNSFEHYHPFSGEPSRYRGVDDYQHSWVNDLILRHVAGIRVEASSIELSPLPCGVRTLNLDELIVAGKRIRVRKSGALWSLWVEGRLCFRGRLSVPVVVKI